jgi:hypothetical protein
MGYELIGKNCTELHINAGFSQLLTKITAGWHPLIGIGKNISKNDCNMIARILTNYANLQEVMDDNLRKVINWEKEDLDSIDWLLSEAVPFFRNCGGCRRNDG